MEDAKKTETQDLASIESAGEIMMNAPLLEQIDAMATRMATAKNTIPAHLKGNTGDCWAVIMQALQWKMNPFVVAQKTHVVNGTLGYEAQLVNAVVKSSGAIQGSFKYEYEGDGQSLKCRAGARLKGEQDITWTEWLAFASVTTRNSPLWKTNPRQQMGYLQCKNWTRLYAPEALLGIYTSDELHDFAPQEREVGPGSVSSLNDRVKRTAKGPVGPEEGRVGPEEGRVGPEEAAEGELIEEETPEQAPLAAAGSETVASLSEKIAGAESEDDLAQLQETILDFLGTGDNEKFREEVHGNYKARLIKLRQLADDEVNW